jgi:hypothetical protein
MSETNCAPNESAIEVLRERISLLDGQIEARSIANAADLSTRDVLLDLIATLSRKPRARKPRAIETDTRPANDAEGEVRPSVFAAPCGDTAEAA